MSELDPKKEPCVNCEYQGFPAACKAATCIVHNCELVEEEKTDLT